MVNVSYLDANGNATCFDAEDSKSALKRLSSIKGYINPSADSMTVGLGSKILRKRRAEKFRNGRSAQDAFASSNGIRNGQRTKTLTVCTGLVVIKGEITGIKTRDLYIPDEIGIGGERIVSVELKHVGKQSGEVANQGTKAEQKKTLSLVVGSEYNDTSHKFENDVVKVSVPASWISGEPEKKTVFEAVEETVVYNMS